MTLLQANSEQLTALFQNYRDCRWGASELKGSIVDELLMELEIDSQIEQELVYPMLFDAAMRDLTNLVENNLRDEA